MMIATFSWLRPLAIILSGLIVGAVWWRSFTTFRHNRAKFRAQGVSLKFFDGVWLNGKAHTAGVPDKIESRLLIAYLALVVPLVCFIIARDSNTPFDSLAWQSGPERYFEILLGRDTTTFFYPFAAYSGLAAALLLIAPGRFSRYFVVRFGIYSGTLLAIHFLLLLLIQGTGLMASAFAVAMLIPYAILTSFQTYTKDAESRHFFWATIGLFLWVTMAIFQPFSGYGAGEALMLWGLFPLIGSIYWVAPLGIWWSYQLWPLEKEKENENGKENGAEQGENEVWSKGRIIGMVMWFLSYIYAWQLAVARMFEIYEALPTSPPDCYIATAAAQGHPRLVKSFATVSAQGTVFRINRQLQRLKGFELLLLVLVPQVHVRLRQIYNRIGRRWAKKITHPAVATAVYWSLKPAEWVMLVVLWLLGERCRRLVGRFYSACPTVPQSHRLKSVAKYKTC